MWGRCSRASVEGAEAMAAARARCLVSAGPVLGHHSEMSRSLVLPAISLASFLAIVQMISSSTAEESWGKGL